MGERKQSLDAGKGLAIILVMLGHCIVLNGMQDAYIYDAIKAVQMPFFMLISGYLMGMPQRIASVKGLELIIRKRALAYLLPFFSWIVLLHPTSIILSTKEILFQLDKGLWFLMTLFILTVVMYIAVYLQDNTRLARLGFVGVWLLFILILLLQTKTKNTFLSPHLTIFHLPFYLGGYSFCRLKLEKITQNKALLFFLGVLGALMFGYLITGYDMVVANNKIELLLQITAGFLGSYVCICGVVLIKGSKAECLLARIGRFTLEIYVIHFHFATLLKLEEKEITLLSMEGGLWVMAAFALMSLLTAGSIVLLKRFKITNLLLFGKQ